MPIADIFGAGAESPLASYSYVDLATGTGIIHFYGSIDQSGGGLLSTTDVYSNLIETGAANTNVDFTKIIDIDFDAVINRPLNIRGNIYANVPLTYATDTATYYAVIKFRKWDGATETEIANGTSSQTGSPSASTKYMLLVNFSTAATHFKIGETLRMTVEIWAKYSGSTGTVYLGHDPKGRNAGTTHFGTNSTELSFFIPTKIDI